jgi:hypothetical protein
MTIDLLANLSLNDLPATQGAPTDLTVGSRPAKQVKSPAGCLISIGVTSSSRVDTNTIANDPSQACSISLSATKAIEPNLPSS